MTSLHCAAHFDHIEVVKCLVEKGANVNVVDKDGLTARDHAEAFGHEEIDKFFDTL